MSNALQNIKDGVDLQTLFNVAARTSTVNGAGVDMLDYEGKAQAILGSAAGTGTSPTLDVKLQDSDDNSTFADITDATFTQVTNAAVANQGIAVDLAAARRYVRAVATIGGTSPSFSCGVWLLAKKKYVA
jgi:hypothetical protein